MPRVALTHHAIDRWKERINPEFSIAEVTHCLKNARQMEWSAVQKMTKNPNPDCLYWKYRDVVMVVKHDGDDWYVMRTVWKVNKVGKFRGKRSKAGSER